MTVTEARRRGHGIANTPSRLVLRSPQTSPETYTQNVSHMQVATFIQKRKRKKKKAWFDISPLRQVLVKLPATRWVTYYLQPTEFRLHNVAKLPFLKIDCFASHPIGIGGLVHFVLLTSPIVLNILGNRIILLSNIVSACSTSKALNGLNKVFEHNFSSQVAGVPMTVLQTSTIFEKKWLATRINAAAACPTLEGKENILRTVNGIIGTLMVLCEIYWLEIWLLCIYVHWNYCMHFNLVSFGVTKVCSKICSTQDCFC